MRFESKMSHQNCQKLFGPDTDWERAISTTAVTFTGGGGGGIQIGSGVQGQFRLFAVQTHPRLESKPPLQPFALQLAFVPQVDCGSVRLARAVYGGGGGGETYRYRFTNTTDKLATAAGRVGIAVKGARAPVEVAVLGGSARVLRDMMDIWSAPCRQVPTLLYLPKAQEDEKEGKNNLPLSANTDTPQNSPGILEHHWNHTRPHNHSYRSSQPDHTSPQ